MYELTPTQDKEDLFFRLDSKAAERHGVLGYMRAAFGDDGRGFRKTWFDEQKHLKTSEFKAEIDKIINSLHDDGERPPFASRRNLIDFCDITPGKQLNTMGNGYMIRTENYSYYIRCKPAFGDSDVYCFVYDNRFLLPELAGKHELPEYCYSTMPTSGEIIVVRSGERGCYSCQYNEHNAAINREYVDKKNGELGITRAQEEAMRAGGLFGWDIPAAKPWHYDKNGNLLPQAPNKNEPER